MKVDEYQKLKAKADKLKVDISKAEGAYENVMQQIKDEFDCDTLEEAENLLEKLQAQAEEDEQSYNEAVKNFNDKWSEKLRN